MKIALLAPFEERVPPVKYGGTELIVYYLANILPKRGHKVFLFASGDSKTESKLMPIFPKSIRAEPYAKNSKIREAVKYIGISKVIKTLKELDVDIIHNHIGWRFFPFTSFFPNPTVTTLHGPLDTEYGKFMHSWFKEQALISISNSQRMPLPNLNYAGTVYNGIDVNGFEFNSKPGDYFAFLGRMSPEKGPVQAIQIAKAAGVKLKMAAKVDASDATFFEKEVKPLIDNKQIEFLGEIESQEKSNFLKNARGLIAPIQWAEPFGLFFVEAMACGTPVITMNRGSAPEVIKNGKTGFVLNNIEEATNAVNSIDKIKREDCRKWVEKNFSAEIMVENYEKIYHQLIK
jgi:glycosyltransferase involved in cell wall biosynthesis